MKALIFMLLLCISPAAFAQVSISGNANLPDPSAMLDIKSTNRGLLLPSMTLAQRNAIASPATGLIIYQTDGSVGFYYNSGSKASPFWQRLDHFKLPYFDNLSYSGAAIAVTNTMADAGIGIHATAGNFGIWGETVSNAQSATGVRGSAGFSGETIQGKYGVLGETDSGKGVVGVSKTSYGVLGFSANSFGVNGQGLTSGVYGLSWGPNSSGVLGVSNIASGPSYGVRGMSSSPEGWGVAGYNVSITGAAQGIRGQSYNSPDGQGVYGAASKYGVYGHSIATDGDACGVFGDNLSPGGSGVSGSGIVRGVSGTSTITGGKAWGVLGVTSADAGLGVQGIANSISGITYGMAGKALSVDGFGVYGEAPKTGIYGKTTVTAGFASGVKGETASSLGYGIEGLATSATGQTYGVRGESNSTSGTGVFGYATASSGNTYALMGGASSTSGTAIYGYAPAASGLTYGVRASVSSPAGYSGYFSGGRFYITGNTGIGTPEPSGKLEIAASFGDFLVINDLNGSNDRPGIKFKNNESHFICGDDGSNELFGFYSNFSNNRVYDAKLAVYGKSAASWGNFIGLTHNGTDGLIDTDLGDILMLPATGRVGIGNIAPSQSLDVNGNARFRSIGSGAYAGVICRTSDGTLTTATSDARQKNNVQTLQNSLEKVLRLRGISFTWKNDPAMGTRIGFIAQEFEKVIPELVFTNKEDGYKGINYAEISALLVEAIKTLKAENEQLKQVNMEQNTRLEKLEKMMIASPSQ